MSDEKYYGKEEDAVNCLEFLIESSFSENPQNKKEARKVKEIKEYVLETASNILGDVYYESLRNKIGKEQSMNKAYTKAVSYVELQDYEWKKQSAKESLKKRGLVKVNGKTQRLYGDIWETWWQKDLPQD